jgi:hypothetical protein
MLRSSVAPLPYTRNCLNLIIFEADAKKML